MNLLNVLRDLVDVAAAQQRVDEYKDAYDNVVAELRDRNARLGVLEQREEALAAALEEARSHLECFSIDNAELERVNEALRNGLTFFDPSKETP